MYAVFHLFLGRCVWDSSPQWLWHTPDTLDDRLDDWFDDGFDLLRWSSDDALVREVLLLQ